MTASNPIPTQPDEPKAQLLLVASLSGAGKSTALQVFEDLDFLTVDGLQPSMLLAFVQLALQSENKPGKGLAIGLDFRNGNSVAEFFLKLGELEAQGLAPVLIFLEAEPEVLVRRYATTRRPHPLEREGLSLGQAMTEEALRLTPVRSRAALVLDTSNCTLHDLRRMLQHRWGQGRAWKSSLRLNLISFGYKYGLPEEADLVLDLRFLPNPYFDAQLRSKSGQDPEVADYIFMLDYTREFKNRLLDFLHYLLPLYEAEGRYRLTLALGCTGGRHRSVAVVEMLAPIFAQSGYQTAIHHRDLKKESENPLKR